MTISKLRMSAATGLVVLLLSGGAGAALAASPAETGIEASESATDPTGVEAAGIGHEDPAGQNVDHQFNGEE